MDIAGPLVIAADAVLQPVGMLSPDVRRHVRASDSDYALSRTHSRTRVRIMDADSATLFGEFRRPSTVAEAIIRFSSGRNEDAADTLEAAFPLLKDLVEGKLLVPPESDAASQIRPLLSAGSRFRDLQVVACIQTLEDIELYRAVNTSGTAVALKLMRPDAAAHVFTNLRREAAILQHLAGSPSPRLLAVETGNPAHLLLEWCDGVDVYTAAARLRLQGDESELLAFASAIAEAYTTLHACHVLHADVHPRNLILQPDGRIRILDFGWSRLLAAHEADTQERCGVPYFYDPELAKALRDGAPLPPQTERGEQYAVAALLHLLLTGRHVADFSLEKDDMLDQIIAEGPSPFAQLGMQPWPQLERVLHKALAKDPASRFPSMSSFSAELRNVKPRTIPVTSPNKGSAKLLINSVLSRLKLGGRLLADGLPMAPRTSITYGSAGISCGLCRIACAREDAEILALADVWAHHAARQCEPESAWYCEEIGITCEIVGRSSPFHTEAGVWMTRALVASARADLLDAWNAAERFVVASSLPCDNLDLVLGKSGTLLASAHVEAALTHLSAPGHPALRGLGIATLHEIWACADLMEPIAICNQIRTPTLAHGWAGILFATLEWCLVTGTPYPGFLEDRLHQLTRHDGLLAPSDTPFAESWCNGAAGLVHLWLAAFSAFRNPQFLNLAEAAGRVAQAPASTNTGLCCGLAGQAYAMLALLRATGNQLWLEHARTLAERAVELCTEAPHTPADRPESLYKGDLGLAVLIADLENPMQAAMPAFNVS